MELKSRREFVSVAIGSGALGTLPAVAQQAGSIRPEPVRGPRHDLDMVKTFVVAAHSDNNLEKVKELLAREPKLVYASHDWGDGDWETGLGGGPGRTTALSAALVQVFGPPGFESTLMLSSTV